MVMRVCPRCKESKCEELFNKGYCKPCNAIRYREYKEKNRDKELARKKAYRDANKAKIAEYQKTYQASYNLKNPHWRHRYPEAAKAQDTRRRGYRTAETFPIGVLSEKLAYWGGLCWMCRVAPHEHWDHVKPLSKGGLHLLSNLRPSCAKCNLEKSDQWPYTPRTI